MFPYILHTNEIYKIRIFILGHVAMYDHKRHIAGSLWNEDLVNNSLQSMTGVFITFHNCIVLFLWPYNIQYRTTRLVKTKGFLTKFSALTKLVFLFENTQVRICKFYSVLMAGKVFMC